MRAGTPHGYAWVPQDPSGSTAAKDVFGGRDSLDLEKPISTLGPFIRGYFVTLPEPFPPTIYASLFKGSCPSIRHP